jgi:hypothetical protein
MSVGPDADRTTEIALAELANRAVDLAHRPPDQEHEKDHEQQRSGNQRCGLPSEGPLRRARRRLERVEALVDEDAHARRDAASSAIHAAESGVDGVAPRLRWRTQQHRAHIRGGVAQSRDLALHLRVLRRQALEHGEALLQRFVVGFVEREALALSEREIDLGVPLELGEQPRNALVFERCSHALADDGCALVGQRAKLEDGVTDADEKRQRQKADPDED